MRLTCLLLDEHEMERHGLTFLIERAAPWTWSLYQYQILGSKFRVCVKPDRATLINMDGRMDE